MTLTYKMSWCRDDLAGFQYKLALGVWRETLVQQQDPWTVCGTQRIPPNSSAAAPAVPNVAHLNAEGKLMA